MSATHSEGGGHHEQVAGEVSRDGSAGGVEQIVQHRLVVYILENDEIRNHHGGVWRDRGERR